MVGMEGMIGLDGCNVDKNLQKSMALVRENISIGIWLPEALNSFRGFGV